MNGFDIAGNGPAGSHYVHAHRAIAAVGGEHGLLGASRLVGIDLRNGRATPLLALSLGTVVGLTFVPR